MIDDLKTHTRDLLAGNLKAARLRNGMTQGQLEATSGVARQTIRQIETSQSSATVDTLGKLAQALNISLYVLFLK